jgi:hypothetical protein
MELIKAFVPHLSSQQERDEEYLSQAVDIYDVERRIAEIDHRAESHTFAAPALGGALH